MSTIRSDDPRRQDNPLGLPICRQCGRLMSISRVEPDPLDDDGPEMQTFECTDCGSVVTRSVPLHRRS